jgi:acylphosphatase
MMAESNHERREVVFRGRVQGVGFRYTAVQIAERFPVTGFVKNLPDGRVQLVAEGEPAKVEGFAGAVAAELDRYIADTLVTVSPATGEFTNFSIRF